jgi:hypothetical protein
VTGVAVTPTTPIRRDDTSRLVRDPDVPRPADVMDALEHAKRCLDGLPVYAIYARQAEGDLARGRWVMACQALIAVDQALAAAIATWNGKYAGWNVDGPHPTPDGVKLGCDAFRRGLQTVRARYRTRYVLSDECLEQLVLVVKGLRGAVRLMGPAVTAAKSPLKVAPERQPDRWYDHATPDQCTASTAEDRCPQPAHREGLCLRHLARQAQDQSR